MKKTLKPRKLTFQKSTLRVLCTQDLRDVVGATLNPASGIWKCSEQIACEGESEWCG